jgi:hypothetical protein
MEVEAVAHTSGGDGVLQRRPGVDFVKLIRPKFTDKALKYLLL